MIIDWSYVAGFMDGEGCISQQDCHTWAVWIGQKRPDVLYQIQSFLTKEQVKSSIITARPEITTLRVSGKRLNMKVFLEKVMPYLVVKRQEAQDVLRCYKLFPLRGNQFNYMRAS